MTAGAGSAASFAIAKSQIGQLRLFAETEAPFCSVIIGALSCVCKTFSAYIRTNNASNNAAVIFFRMICDDARTNAKVVLSKYLQQCFVIFI